MRIVPSRITLLTLLLFVDVLLLAMFLEKPYFVIGGILFVSGLAAFCVVLVPIALALLLIYLSLRRSSLVRTLTFVLAFPLILNSIAILATAPFFSEDLSAFLEQVLGVGTMVGFVVLQVFLILNNLLLVITVRGIGRFLGKSRAIPL
jgi:hypothetical protein